MKKNSFLCLGAAILTVSLSAQTSAFSATGTLTTLPEDGQVTQLSGVNAVAATTSQFCSVGGNSGKQLNVVYVFQIPPAVLADPTQEFSAATFTAKLGSTLPAGSTINGDLYGLAYAASPMLRANDFYEGTLDADDDLIADNFLIPSTASYSTVSTSSTALVTYLNTELNSARANGATSAYVFLRVNPDAYVYWAGYTMGMNGASAPYPATLNYTTSTAAGWKTVPFGGGGYVTGIVSNSNGSAIYCRSDVGGAFRWAAGPDGNNGKWISLTDDMAAFGAAGSTKLMNVEAIATDASNLNRVYVGAGSKIYGSDDQGETWYTVSGTITMKGNGPGRSNGERLAVDPNNPNILWYGTISQGLMRGEKIGTSWNWSQISSSSVPFGAADQGVNFVVCDANGGSTIVYAGVKDASAGGVYRSTDGGVTWAKVTGASLPLVDRAQIASNGTLYVTGGSGGAGKILRGGTLQLMTGLPTGVAYHAVAVDPSDATGNTVYVATWDDLIWRSTTGGTSWMKQDTIFNEGPLTATNHQRMEPDGTPCLNGYWFGSVASMMINPANPNELWLSDFFGVSRTRNAQDLGGNPGSWWYTLQKGQEETVVLAQKSAPTGPVLMSGFSDVGGALYYDLNSRPTGAAGRLITSGGNVTSLDFCESNTNCWVRSWVEPDGSGGTGHFSIDGGLNWGAFGQLDAKKVTNNTSGGWETYDLTPFLKTRKAAGVNIFTIAVKGSNSVTNAYVVRFSSKEGANPPQLVIDGGSPIVPVADAMVYKGAQTTNYGQTAELQLQNYYDQNNYTRWFYLRFDLTGVNAINSSATLRLYRNGAADSTAFTTTVHATPNVSWVEGNGGTDNVPAGEITWTGMPTNFYSLPAALGTTYSGGGGRIAISSTDPNRIVWIPIGVNTPAYYSRDRGVTWTASTGGPGSPMSGIYTNGGTLGLAGQCLASDRGNGKFYHAKLGSTGHIIYSSTDGATWTQAAMVNNGGSYNMMTPQLMAAPASPSYPTGGDLWLCDDGSYNGSGGGLWRSVNSGAAWLPISGIGKVTAAGFGKSATGSGYAVYICGYKGSVKGVYRSDDYGASWTQLLVPTICEITAITGDRQTYNSVFIGTHGRGSFRY